MTANVRVRVLQLSRRSAWGPAARALLGVTMVSCLTFTVLPPLASADDLDDRRQQVQEQLNQSQQDLGESSTRLRQAAVSVGAAQAQLSTARQRLGDTRTELIAARAQDSASATRLGRAQADLARATAAVLAGQRGIAAEQDMAGAMARDQYQQQTSLLPIAVLVQSRSIGDLQTRLQWSTTMFDTTQAQLDRLKGWQRDLTANRARQAALEKQVAAERTQAAAALVDKRRLERTATAQTAAVAALLRQRATVQAEAARAVAADRREVAALNRERSSVEHRIAVRIARAQAAAARRAAAARAARLAARDQRAAAAERARAAARHRADRRASHRHSAPVARRHTVRQHSPRVTVRHRRPARHLRPAKSARPRVSASGRHHGFRYPVGARITSPYGRRFHPVLHIWKLHDGTDFSAGCGTPIRAAYAGRVAERYFNGAYGNRLMIDHGQVAGRYVTTGYNHAQRYRVHVGQHVRRGQVIGYVGATGYATGCHLHLMVWLDGRRVDPMSWY